MNTLINQRFCSHNDKPKNDKKALAEKTNLGKTETFSPKFLENSFLKLFSSNSSLNFGDYYTDNKQIKYKE